MKKSDINPMPQYFDRYINLVADVELSVLAMGFSIIGHQIHHLKIIEEKYYPLVS